MRIGIVGSEAAKFTIETEEKARQAIRVLICRPTPDGAPPTIVSGECHLGGIDVWAKQEAEILLVPYLGFPPKVLNWTYGYKPRNMQIAQHSDLVVCFTVKVLPPGYTGMRFPFCYHCKTDSHVKSGGCWTVKYAKALGKQGEVVVIE